MCPDICPKTLSVQKSEKWKKIVSFEEQMMSEDKDPSMLLKSNEGCCSYNPSNSYLHHSDILQMYSERIQSREAL